MNDYLYKAKNLDGHIIKGKFSTSTVVELTDYLNGKGYFLLYCRRLNVSANLIINKRIKKRDLSIFCRQLSVTLQSGIPLIEALTLLAFQSASKVLRESISLLISDIKSGETLYDGLRRSRLVFPDFMLHMVKIGEESGRLEEVLGELSSYYERENKINKKVIGAMFYPATIFFITIIITTTLMITVVPSITSVLTSMGGRIPPLTSAVIFISSFLKEYILHIIFGAFAAAAAAVYVARSLQNDFHKSLLMKLPGIGILYRKLIEIRFARGLSILLSSGVNLINSLELTSNILNNSKVKSELYRAMEEIKEGKGMAEALVSVDSFEPLLLSMIKVGEETGRLDEMLVKLATLLEDETYGLIIGLTEFIQPIMIVMLSGIVGLIIISVVLPMMSIMDTVQ